MVEGGVERLLEMEEWERARWCGPAVVGQLGEWRRYFDVEKVFGELGRMGAEFITAEEAAYPARLNPYADRPVGLYRYRAGKAPGRRSVAIVGTRKPSAYGRKVAREFGSGLSGAGFTVISGLAEGIDTEAHRAALGAGGLTAAVLGGGLKRLYPQSNRALMEEVAASAGVWTEFPLWRKADRRSFPQRNRIVSGMSEAVVVVESGLQGGSLITARMAGEQGKPVYVVPGRIDAPESAGCHGLIRDGAQLVSCVEDILQDLSCFPEVLQQARSGGAAAEAGPPRKREVPELSGLEGEVWTLLERNGGANIEVLGRSLERPVPDISRAVLELELAGHVVRRLDGCYEPA